MVSTANSIGDAFKNIFGNSDIFSATILSNTTNYTDFKVLLFYFNFVLPSNVHIEPKIVIVRRA